MISFAVLFRAVLYVLHHPVFADDHTTQCVAKFRPVAIDTNDVKGGIARTSFLYVEVEADKKFTVEPRICPKVTSLPRCTRYSTLSSPDNHYGCPTGMMVLLRYTQCSATYEDFLTTHVVLLHQRHLPRFRYLVGSAFSIHDPSHHSSGIVAQPTNPPSTCANPHDNYMSQQTTRA